MPYKAFIDIGEGKPIELKSCSYSVFRATNAEGEPHSDIDAGKINISLVGMDESPFYKWSTQPDTKKSGQILFKDSKNKANDRKVLLFTDGYAVEFHESWSGDGDSIEAVTISARKIEIKGASVINEWTGEAS